MPPTPAELLEALRAAIDLVFCEGCGTSPCHPCWEKTAAVREARDRADASPLTATPFQ